jgi:hypothetical protein
MPEPWRVSAIQVGDSGFPLLCIDDFFPDPDSLVAGAERADFIEVGSRYPGVRASAPPEYVEHLLESLSPLVEAHFGAPPQEDLELCAYSMVTLAPGELRAIQRIPHFDGPEPRRIAFLHYLCNAEQGGTSFYRHRVTGLERITPDRTDEYTRRVVAEIKAKQPAHGYVDGDTPYFEKLHGVDAAFNRLIVYPGNALHSGDIAAHGVRSEDPRRGRLTINGFGFLRR